MLDASKNLALKCQPSYFSVNILDMDGVINKYTIWCFVDKKFPINRKWQDYVYIQCEYKSTKQKIKHLLREENKVKENKIS